MTEQAIDSVGTDASMLISLAEFMSDLSEQAWRAGWMEGLEYELWRAIVDGPCRLG